MAHRHLCAVPFDVQTGKRKIIIDHDIDDTDDACCGWQLFFDVASEAFLRDESVLGSLADAIDDGGFDCVIVCCLCVVLSQFASCFPRASLWWRHELMHRQFLLTHNSAVRGVAARRLAAPFAECARARAPRFGRRLLGNWWPWRERCRRAAARRANV